MRGRVAHRLIRFDPERALEMHSLSRVSIDKRNSDRRREVLLDRVRMRIPRFDRLVRIKIELRDFLKIDSGNGVVRLLLGTAADEQRQQRQK